MSHFLYIVRCVDGTFYTGYARDARDRERVHNTGRGARYTSGRRPVTLVYSEAFRSLGAALRREHQLKQLSRAEKHGLVAGTLKVPRLRSSSRLRRPPTTV